MLDVFDLTPGRPAGDILSRVVRVSIGGVDYALPVRSIKANREWRDSLHSGTVGLLAGLDASGDDFASIYATLASQMELLVELLVSYDTSGVLPSKDEIEAIEPDCSLDVVAAVKEVWRAANPLVVTSIEAIERMTTPEPDSSPPTSTPAPHTAIDRPRRSRKH